MQGALPCLYFAGLRCFLTGRVSVPVQGFIESIAAPMLQQLGRAVPFAASVALPLAQANAENWGRLGSPEAAAADALGATIPPERPHIGTTALACAVEHAARREAEAAAGGHAAAPAGALSAVHAPVAVL